MSNLPRLDKPSFPVHLLSQKKPVHITAYTVKESKILMLARESNDPDWYYNAIKQVLTNCMVEKLDIDTLPLIDVEWLFINLQARSIGENLQLDFGCTNEVTDPNTFQRATCGNVINVSIKLLDIPIVNKAANKTIMLTDKVGMQMRYPNFETTKLIKASDTMVDIGMAALCIETIFDEHSVHKADDVSPDELVQFVEELPTDKYQQIGKFLEECPILRYNGTTKCTKCGYEHSIELEGLDSFFA